MKHIFVVNPHAGRRNASHDIVQRVHAMGLDSEVYVTKAPRDATRFVAEWIARHAGEAVRFYACGGDGTLGEVAAGIMAHTGGDGASVELTCYPCGSGNDFIKYYGQAPFSDLEALTKGSARSVDVMRVGGRYCLNTLNFGFEAAVCHTMNTVRRLPLVGGRLAYTTGIVKSLATSMHNPAVIEVDGKAWYEGDLLLASASNGMYAGGGYMSAPRAMNDDGLLEVLAVKPMPVARFAKLIDYYKRGQHLDRPEMVGVLAYCRAQRLSIESRHDFYIATDGEVMRGRRFEIECIPQALRFAVPTSS